jgi:hypothetical protein
MRKKMHKVLNSFGLSEKSGQTNRSQLFDALTKQGAERLPPVSAARWWVSHAPMDSITSWESVDGIAGQVIDAELKAKILKMLFMEAQSLFTDLHKALETEETYELNAIKLHFNQH